METPRRKDGHNLYGFPGGQGEPAAIAKPHTIILVDDHVLFRRGIRRLIEGAPNLRVVGEAGDGFEALELLKEFTPDLVILAISMPKCGGMAASREIKRLYPGVKLMMLTLHRDEEYLRRALGVGVDGYLLKEDADEHLLEAIWALNQGKTYFAPLRLTYGPPEPWGRTAMVLAF